jgi:hypothetical protein
MALFRSGENLFTETLDFTSKSASLRVYSPFIRVGKLHEILNGKKCEFIVTRWLPGDILQGVTDFKELFDYCNSNDIKLYRNPNIHLKVIQRDDNALHYGSANITKRGMGSDLDQINLELSGVNFMPDFEDILYLEKILRSSHLVDQFYFNQLEQQIKDLEKNFKKTEPIPDFTVEIKRSDKFLLSALPMSASPEILWTIYSTTDRALFGQADIDSAKHDITNYSIPAGLDRTSFFEYLQEKVNSHPFIAALKKAISEKDCLFMGYTEICIWLSNNTTTDPNPRRWEIKQMNNVPILRNWICYFDKNFVAENRYPDGSDLIKYVKGKVYSIETVLETLNRDVAHGKRAPHQIILLITLKNLSKNRDNRISLAEIKEDFQQVWNTYIEKHSSFSSNFAMPIHALTRVRLLRLNNNESRYRFKDYRSEAELLSHFDSVLLINDLKEILDVTPLERLVGEMN